MKTRLFSIGLICLLVMSQSLFSEEIDDNAAIPKGSNNYKKHIENTIWIVPPSTLLAYEYIDGTSAPVSDQTVWVIDNYDQGYFFGTAYASINQSTLSSFNLVGSITPHGDVYITFFPLSGSSQSTDIVAGIGIFTKIHGKYQFIMQMNSAQNTLEGLAHWSYMISVKPDDYFYQNLPGENMSVPEFLSQF